MSVSYVERDQADAETIAFYDKSEDRFQAGPKGASQIDQCASPKAPTFGAVLVKGMPKLAP